MSVKEIPLENTIESSLPDYSNIKIKYDKADIQDTPEDLAVKKETLQRIVDCVYEISQIDPDKNYLELYNLRYEKGLTQKEIAAELNISQSEVSKRLFKLMNNVKQAIL